MKPPHRPDNSYADYGSVRAKSELREELLRRRSALPKSVRKLRAEALARHLLKDERVRRASTIACYRSIGTEPGTGPLLAALLAQGKRVLLPVLLADNDLDWAVYDGADSLTRGQHGLLEPSGKRLGPAAIGKCEVVLVPGLAVDREGHRLGRGGGSYDRALRRVDPTIGAFSCMLASAEELLDVVPVDAHDQPVSAVATELGITEF